MTVEYYRCAKCNEPSSVRFSGSMIRGDLRERLERNGWAVGDADQFLDNPVLCPECKPEVAE